MKTVTLEQIAQQASVHRTTVSLALRNDPRIPTPTRERLQSLAREMGYTPNPLVTALMKQRASRHPGGIKSTLAYLDLFTLPGQRKASHSYTRLFEGARQCAESHGFRLEPILLRQHDMTPQLLQRLLTSRNLHAVIVSPVPADAPSADWIDWGRLSAIAIGHSLRSPLLHKVSHDYYGAMMLAIDRLKAAGIKRMALLLHHQDDERIAHLWLAAYLARRHLSPRGGLLPPLRLGQSTPGIDKERLRRYMARHQPEAILYQPWYQPILVPISEAKKPPLMVNLGLREFPSQEVGIYQNPEAIGAEAVHQLLTLLHANQRGLPLQPRHTLISGLWNEPAHAETTDPQPRKEAPRSTAQE